MDKFSFKNNLFFLNEKELSCHRAKIEFDDKLPFLTVFCSIDKAEIQINTGVTPNNNNEPTEYGQNFFVMNHPHAFTLGGELSLNGISFAPEKLSLSFETAQLPILILSGSVAHIDLSIYDCMYQYSIGRDTIGDLVFKDMRSIDIIKRENVSEIYIHPYHGQTKAIKSYHEYT